MFNLLDEIYNIFQVENLVIYFNFIIILIFIFLLFNKKVLIEFKKLFIKINRNVFYLFIILLFFSFLLRISLPKGFLIFYDEFEYQALAKNIFFGNFKYSFQKYPFMPGIALFYAFSYLFNFDAKSTIYLNIFFTIFLYLVIFFYFYLVSKNMEITFFSTTILLFVPEFYIYSNISKNHIIFYFFLFLSILFLKIYQKNEDLYFLILSFLASLISYTIRFEGIVLLIILQYLFLLCHYQKFLRLEFFKKNYSFFLILLLFNFMLLYFHLITLKFFLKEVGFFSLLNLKNVFLNIINNFLTFFNSFFSSWNSLYFIMLIFNLIFLFLLIFNFKKYKFEFLLLFLFYSLIFLKNKITDIDRFYLLFYVYFSLFFIMFIFKIFHRNKKLTNLIFIIVMFIFILNFFYNFKGIYQKLEKAERLYIEQQKIKNQIIEILKVNSNVVFFVVESVILEPFYCKDCLFFDLIHDFYNFNYSGDIFKNKNYKFFLIVDKESYFWYSFFQEKNITLNIDDRFYYLVELSNFELFK